jgi:hypothetical protein
VFFVLLASFVLKHRLLSPTAMVFQRSYFVILSSLLDILRFVF